MKNKRTKSKEEGIRKSVKNKASGITLIALVITIIVLLILAAVSITTLTGQNGILKRTVDAKDATRGGEVQETVALEATNNTMADYTNGPKKTRADVINELHSQGKLTDEEVAALENSDVITIGGVEIDFSVLGSYSGAKTLVQAFIDEDINVGDYITNYNDTLKSKIASKSVTEEKTGFAGTQTYKVDTTTTWRVLGLNEDKTQLMITTGSPIKKVMNSSGEEWEQNPYLYLDGAEGWYWAGENQTNNILDEICAIYDGKYASSTKSMRIDDINVALGLKLDKENNKIYKIDDTSQTALPRYMGFFGQSYKYKIDDYAPENYLKAKYSTNTTYNALTNKKSGDPVAGTAFMYEYSDASIIEQDSKLYEVLFDGTTGSSNGKSYWLASPGVGMDVSFCGFGPGAVGEGYAGTGGGLFVSDGVSYEVWLGVRPVVYLQSGVTVENLIISSSGSEGTWTTTLPDSFGDKPLDDYGQITE